MALDEPPGTEDREVCEMSDPLAYSPEQAAVQLGIGRTVVYALLKSGELPSFTVGRSRRIPAAALQAFVAQRMAASLEASGVETQQTA